MKNKLRKILSVLLAAGILAGATAFAVPALAAGGVTLDLKGGKYVDPADERAYEPGETLPTYEDLTNDGLTFVGWYKEADFSGEPVYTEPSDAETLHARWVVHDVNTDTFDTADTTMNKWSGWHTAVSTNTDPDHAINGGNSLKVVLEAGTSSVKGGDIQYGAGNWAPVGDGVCLWIEAEEPTELTVSFGTTPDKSNSRKLETISVPKGKSYITAPWTPEAKSAAWVNYISFSLTQGKTNTIYLDSLGTYTEATETAGTINYHMSGAEWSENYTAPTRYSTPDGKTSRAYLPVAEQVAGNNVIFLGWYDNAEFSGNALTQTPAVAEKKDLYAKTALYDVNIDTFDNYDTTEDFSTQNHWSTWISNSEKPFTASVNEDPAYSQQNKSLKLDFTGNSGGTIYSGRLNFPKNATGFYMWVLSDIEVKINVKIPSSISTPLKEITVKPGVETLFTAPFTEQSSGTYYSLQVGFTPTAAGTLYLDNFGTYTEDSSAFKDITYNLNGGKWGGTIQPRPSSRARALYSRAIMTLKEMAIHSRAGMKTKTSPAAPFTGFPTRTETKNITQGG